MASKATPAELQAIGFEQAQFGASAQPDFSAYLRDVLDRAAEATQREVTAAAYSAASGLQDSLLRDAELAWATAELYRRRSVTQDANAKVASQNSGYLTLREYEKLADRYEERFREIVAQFEGETPAGTGATMGHIETGHYSKESDKRLN